MKDGYQLYFKFAENGTYREYAVLPTLAEAMANSHLGDSREAYAEPAEWRETVNAGTWMLADHITSEMARSSPWLIEKVRIAETDTDRIELAAELGFQYGSTDGDHHKMWVIDQMLRLLLGDSYDARVAQAKDGEDGPDTYGWDTGIAP
jgi:hypothetical protein